MTSKKYQAEVEKALALFAPKNPLLKRKFLNAVMFYMQTSGICFMDYLIIESNQIEEDFKRIKKTLPRRQKGKKA